MKQEEIHQEYPHLSRIPKATMEAVLLAYEKFFRTYKYVRYILLIAMIAVFIYNFGFAGKRYSISEYNMIRTVFVVVLLSCVAGLLLLLVLIIGKMKPVKNILKEESKKQGTAYRVMKKEFNAFVKKYYRGVPI